MSTTSRYRHLCAYALDHPWALTPDMLRVVASILSDRLTGGRASDEQIASALALRKNDLPQPTRGGVMVIPVYGVLSPRMNMLSESSGGTSYERLGAHLREGLAHSDVSTIVLDIDSPGGSVAGAAELASQIRAARAQKPIIAVANHQCASAAYWLASNATKVHASPSASVGSIGVFTIHHDLSEMLAKAGIKRTLVAAGKYKLDGLDGEPLSESALAYRTDVVGKTYERFVGHVAAGRGVSPSVVRKDYGEGRCLDADDALTCGMVDKIATLDETLDRLLPAGESRPVLDFSSRSDTPQELAARATGQDRRVDVHWQARIERALLELSMP